MNWITTLLNLVMSCDNHMQGVFGRTIKNRGEGHPTSFFAFIRPSNKWDLGHGYHTTHEACMVSFTVVYITRYFLCFATDGEEFCLSCLYSIVFRYLPKGDEVSSLEGRDGMDGSPCWLE